MRVHFFSFGNGERGERGLQLSGNVANNGRGISCRFSEFSRLVHPPSCQAYGGTVQLGAFGEQFHHRFAGNGIVQFVLLADIKCFRGFAVSVAVIVALLEAIRNFLIGAPLAGAVYY